jgi:hypothetical protein
LTFNDNNEYYRRITKIIRQPVTTAAKKATRRPARARRGAVESPRAATLKTGETRGAALIRQPLVIQWAGVSKRGGADAVLKVSVRDGADKEAYLKRFKALVDQVPDLMSKAPEESQRERLAKIAELAIPTPDVTESPLELWNLKEQQLWKYELAEEFHILSSADVAKLAQSSAKNSAATANRWKSEQRIFSVPIASGLGFLGFQFDANGQPKPAVREVLTRLNPDRADWATAFWFTAANAHLDGERPVDRMDTDSKAVIAAAEQDRPADFG